jgi:antitoxin component YwqK of YwqJK toxin-antitoxin module
MLSGPMNALLLAASILATTLTPGDKKPARAYLSNVMEPTTRGKAAYYKVAAGQDGSAYVGKIFTMDDVLKAEGRYADAALEIEHGHFIYYFPDGTKESEGDYAMGYKSGVWLRYDEWGQQLAEKVYDPTPLENIVYTMAPTMPQYPGGDQAMISYLKSKAVGAEGATATFVVEKDGDLSGIKVIGAQPATSDQLVQALDRAPRFEAGEKDGVPVRVQMRVPLK